ncbi:MAG: FAD-linked oxidase C-terminal domain-containing protein, partial [Candidatus Spechtbacterales bacterium]|nr:FAD-linked oxidase C-terminal domain-containing protein [Candidatus Spechtbacterales bacterium]
FIDDFIVKPEYLPEVLPKVHKILKEYGIHETIAGHAGSGNFHIIPLMDLSKEENKAKIPEVSKKIYDLVIEYKGSITAEHNDGLVRSPYLEQMYGDKVYDLFEETKRIFDPQNIFNPGKKVNSSMEYAMKHIDHK